VISFRTRQEGWVTLESGYAFHTVDGGETFTPVPANGHTLAFASARRTALRRAGSATSPSRRSTGYRPSAGGVRHERSCAARYDGRGRELGRGRVASTRRSGICLPALTRAARSGPAGTEGPNLPKPRRRGDSFQRTRTTPFSPKEKCVHLSFADESVGWAASHDTLYETRDGGDTWKQFSPSLLRAGPGQEHESFAPILRRVGHRGLDGGQTTRTDILVLAPKRTSLEARLRYSPPMRASTVVASSVHDHRREITRR
jgi:hypothetical protein